MRVAAAGAPAAATAPRTQGLGTIRVSRLMAPTLASFTSSSCLSLPLSRVTYATRMNLLSRRFGDGDEGSENRGRAFGGANRAFGGAGPAGTSVRPPPGTRVRPEARRSRPAPPYGSPGPRATGQAHGASRVRLRQPLLGGLRDRGDPQGRGPHRRLGGVLDGHADHVRHPRGPGRPAVLLPPDHQGVPFVVLHAFASGGAAVTGVEAISNGVPAFRPPEWRNARTTLMWMGSLLGAMFLGLSYISVKLQVVPSETKTVISEVGRAVFGGGAIGYGLFLMLQVATTLILILAANTSFADFPRLANFHATDNFMPRQLTKRGHRLVFSNGIIGLAIAATLVVVVL